MSRKRKCRYTPEELALHKEAVRLRNMTDKQLVRPTRMALRRVFARRFLFWLTKIPCPTIYKIGYGIFGCSPHKEHILKYRHIHTALLWTNCGLIAIFPRLIRIK